MIERYGEEFGVVWLLKKFRIYPNAYYNYKKRRKANYFLKQEMVLKEIEEIYHERNGIPGYRMMRELLKTKGIRLSALTVHRYMNRILGLRSITRKKKPAYRKGDAHKKFPNRLNRTFTASEENKVWCTDFTYLALTDGTMRYNCAILDLYQRKIVASKSSKRMDAQLSVETLEEALKQAGGKRGVLLHSDQGSPYTSKQFTEYCKDKGVLQSMSRAGCPYDNAPMERYFNTLKAELINQKAYRSEQTLYADIQSYTFGWYNQIRPHSYNGGLPPAQVR